MENTGITFRKLYGYFVPRPIINFEWLSEPVRDGVEKFAYLIFLLLIFVGIIKLFKRKLTLIDCYCLGYFMVIALWPYERTTRYIFPITIFAMIYLIDSYFYLVNKVLSARFHQWANSFLKLILVAGVFYNIYCTYHYRDFNDDVIFTKENQQMFAWVKNNVDADKHYMFRKPRTLSLMSGRTGRALPLKAPAQQKSFEQFLTKNSVEFIIVRRDIEHRDWISFLNKFYRRASVWRNAYFSIYHIKL